MAAGKTVGRIITTQNVDKNLNLADDIWKRHKDDGTGSFLNQLEDAKWEDIGPTIAMARTKHKAALDLKRQMEEAFAERDRLVKPITAINNASKKLLKGKYASNPKKLGDWGFDVDDSPAKPRAKKSKEVK